MGFADGKNMRRLSRCCLLFLMAAIPVVAAATDAAQERVLTQGRIVMGTVLRITLTEPRPGKGEAIFERAFREARNLDLMLSHYRSDSALSQLNALAGQGSTEVPDELYRVLQMSARFSRLTEGAFDVTLGPLFRAWESAGRSGRLPQDLTRTLRRVGWRHLEFQDKNRVGLRRRGMRLNLGAVGKGFAVDKVIDVLRRSGVCCALVDFGGSAFFALGAPDGDRVWNLWVPGIDAQSPIGVVSLRDQALSVSSAFGNKFVIQGRAYGHILDPRTGRPITRPAVAAVIAPSGAEADALSTALLVLGSRRGPAVLERFKGVRALYDSEAVSWISRPIILSPEAAPARRPAREDNPGRRPSPDVRSGS